MIKITKQFAFYGSRSRVTWVVLIAVVQAVAALYFLVDGVDDMIAQTKRGIGVEMIMDCVVAIALVSGLLVAANYARHMADIMHRTDVTLKIAKGALAEQIALRFQEWGLTKGEAEVALFAMKGCNVAEIAQLRSAATGTVRSQLSQVYAKASVSSQSMLVSLFIEDLLDLPPTK
jgi:DNA-binding CsgD family transcriptional regulator